MRNLSRWDPRAQVIPKLTAPSHQRRGLNLVCMYRLVKQLRYGSKAHNHSIMSYHIMIVMGGLSLVRWPGVTLRNDGPPEM